MTDEEFAELLRQMDAENEDPKVLERLRRALESGDDSEDIDPVTAAGVLFVLRKYEKPGD